MVAQLCDVRAPHVKEAILHTAAVYKWGSDPEVGNFVPKGEMLIMTSHSQNEPNYLCQFSHVINTGHDKHIWSAQKRFEEHVQSRNGFNRGQKSRRAWQDGSTADNANSGYMFTSQIFVRRNDSSRAHEMRTPYKLHDWIKAVTGPGSQYIPNPDRPSLFELCDGELRDIKACNPPYLKSGDLVWISFGVEFIIGADLWSTTFTPFEIIRVATVSPEVLGDSGDRAPLSGPAPQPRLQVGMKIQLSKCEPWHNVDLR
ncbi:hypothetical protein FKP32DRAFT_1567363 [Trametes sanguinea]|nr:hypothetical protein FKP32DRAFT_1567363 [Trametes sanguinea]